MNVLLTSIGRRVEMVEFFKDTLRGIGNVYSADADKTAPGLYCAERGFIVPKVDDPLYISSLVDICKQKKVDLVIPFIDPELMILARSKVLIEAETGAKILVSDEDVIATCADKLQTANLFKKAGIPSVDTCLTEEFYWQGKPVVIKPRQGSAGIGIYKCDNHEEYKRHKHGSDTIVQPLLQGSEVTIDVLCDFDSCLLAAVPRKRLKVRAGEVERGVTVEAPELLNWAEKIVETLKPAGPLNIQCFITEMGPLFSEVNARFGGGYPLSYHAGVDFPKMILEMVAGKKVKPQIGTYKRDLLLLRYDKAVVLEKKDLLR